MHSIPCTKPPTAQLLPKQVLTISGHLLVVSRRVAAPLAAAAARHGVRGRVVQRVLLAVRGRQTDVGVVLGRFARGGRGRRRGEREVPQVALLQRVVVAALARQRDAGFVAALHQVGAALGEGGGQRASWCRRLRHRTL